MALVPVIGVEKVFCFVTLSEVDFSRDAYFSLVDPVCYKTIPFCVKNVFLCHKSQAVLELKS